MNTIYKILFCAYGLLLCTICFAQDKIGTDQKPEMGIGMRSSGKIYVVVAVVVTILLGFVLYLVRLDRKIRRLEKNNN